MDYFSNPIPQIAEGLLTGANFGFKLRQARQQEQEFRTRQALEQQRMSIDDIRNQMMLQQNARPVSDYGTVPEQVAPVPPSPTISLDGTTIRQGTVAAPGYTGERKARAADTVTYRSPVSGQTRKWELKTPEEQQQEALALETLKKRIGMTRFPRTPEQQAQGQPSELWIPDQSVPGFLTEEAQNRPLAGLPQEIQDKFGGMNFRLRDLPSIMTTMNAIYNQRAQDQRVEKQIAGRKDVETTRQTAEDKRAAERNKTTIEAAKIRRTPTTELTPYQKDIRERRFQMRRDAVQKEIEDIQRRQGPIYKRQTQIGELLSDPDISAAERLKLTAEYSGNENQLNMMQDQKARASARGRLIGSPADPDAAPPEQAAPDGGGGGPIRFVLPDGKTEIHFDSDEGFQRYLKDHPELQVKR